MSRCKGKTNHGKVCKNQAIDDSGFCRRHHPDPKRRPSKGLTFEEDVASILRLLGYRVERNVTLAGVQVDLFAEMKTGVIGLRLMVECKDYDTKQTVGVEEVKEFLGTLVAVRGKQVDKGLMVARSTFTRAAKELAENAGVDAVSFSDLQNQLVDFGSYLDRVISEFDRNKVAATYIDLSYSESEDFTLNPVLIHRPLDDAVNCLLFDNQKIRLALLGNFGTGKSTWCKKYARDLAFKYKQTQSGRIPILISLSDYDSNVDIQQLIINTLQYTYGVRIDTQICQELQRLGRFLFLFDGFDEMAIRVDPDVVRENLREIAKIGRIPSNVYILTCRTHFFRDRVQAEVLADFDVLYIPEWGKAELREYLQLRFKDGWEHQLGRIDGTHNLAELAETPLFLEMIVATLPQLGDEVRRCDLYDRYTQRWIVEESGRRGSRLSSDQRRAFISDLAIHLYRDDKLAYHYSDFPSLLKLRLKIEDAATMDYLQSDVQNCTFVTRTSSGHYEFRHKSFKEFFVAKAIAAQLQEQSQELFSLKLLPSEIRQFLAELLQSAPPADILRQWLESAPEGPLKDNTEALLIDLRIPISMNTASEVSESEKRVVQFLQGDADAFGRIFAEYTPILYTFLRGKGAEHVIIEDVISDVFFKLLEGRQRLPSVKDFQSYLLRFAQNLYLDQLRRRNRVMDADSFALRLSEFDPDDLPAIESLIDPKDPKEEENRRHLEQKIEKALSRLSERERTVIERNLLQGERLSDIAKDLNLSLGMVKKTAQSARSSLVKHLSESLDNKLS